MATTVAGQGQITIPKPAREHLEMGPSSQVAFRRADDGSIVIEKADRMQQRSRFANPVVTGMERNQPVPSADRCNPC